MNQIDTIRLIIDVALLFGLCAFTYKFYKLQGVVILSLKDAVGLLLILAKYKTMESPEKYVARLCNMSEEDAKLEIERGNLIDLMSGKAMCIVGTLRASVGGSDKMIDELEAQIRG